MASKYCSIPGTLNCKLDMFFTTAPIFNYIFINLYNPGLMWHMSVYVQMRCISFMFLPFTVFLFAFSGCSGGGSASMSTPSSSNGTYTVGGNVSGLATGAN